MPGPSILRSDVLSGVAIAVASMEATGLGASLEALGASVSAVALEPGSLDEPELPEAGALVVDVSAAPSAQVALDAAWLVVRRAGERQIPKVVLIAPAGDEAARAGIENLARTTSIEWARFDIRIGAVLPAAGTPAEVVADFVAYLVSPAGDYFSGAALTLA